jgi:hypothetical protein
LIDDRPVIDDTPIPPAGFITRVLSAKFGLTAPPPGAYGCPLMLESPVMLDVFTSPSAYTLDTLIGAVCVTPPVDRYLTLRLFCPLVSSPNIERIPCAAFVYPGLENPIISETVVPPLTAKFRGGFVPDPVPPIPRVLRFKLLGIVPTPDACKLMLEIAGVIVTELSEDVSSTAPSTPLSDVTPPPPPGR